MAQTITEKYAKAFTNATSDQRFEPHHFAWMIKTGDIWAARALNQAAFAWFQLMEIDDRYGLGDPLVSEIGSRFVNEIMSDYNCIPAYNPKSLDFVQATLL
jgi:hypothetical protein